MSASDPHSVLYRGRDPLLGHEAAGKRGKVTRYYAGKAPEWADQAEEEEEQQRILIKDEHAHRRLQRLRGDAESRDQRVGRRERAAVVLEMPKEEKKERGMAQVIKQEEDIEEDSDLEEKRKRARLIAKAKAEKGDDLLDQGAWAVEDEEDEDAEDSEEYETESEEEDGGRTMAKPVFVAKHHRETEKEKLRLQEEAEAIKLKNIERKQQQQEDSKKLLFDMVRAEQEAKEEVKSDDELLPDDADGANEAEEYELWRIRELKRFRREKALREKRAAEQAEVERRRNMTDEERKADDERLDKLKPKKDKEKDKYQFMQKYFHKGAYFMDKEADGSEPLYLRNFHEPTAADKVDKQALPKVMQLRRGQWGIKGQVKHQHLGAADTTKGEKPLVDPKILAKMESKMAATKGAHAFDRPSKRGI